MSHEGLDYLAEQWEAVARTDKRSHAISPATDYEASGAFSAGLLFELIPPDWFMILLEFGCGDGRVTQHLAGRYKLVLAIDAAPSMLMALENRRLPNVQTVCSNGADLRLTFTADALYSAHTLMHNRKVDVPAILSGLRGVVLRGAPFALQLPCYEEKPKDAENWTDIAVWTPGELTNAAQAAGFDVESLAVNEGAFEWGATGPNHSALHLLRAA